MVGLRTRLFVHEEATKDAFIKVKADFSSVRDYIDALKESINQLNSDNMALRNDLRTANENFQALSKGIIALKDNISTLEKHSVEILSFSAMMPLLNAWKFSFAVLRSFLRAIL